MQLAKSKKRIQLFSVQKKRAKMIMESTSARFATKYLNPRKLWNFIILLRGHMFQKINGSIATGIKSKSFGKLYRCLYCCGCISTLILTAAKFVAGTHILNFERCPTGRRHGNASELIWFVTEEQLKSHNEKVHEKVHVCPYDGCDFKTKGKDSRTACFRFCSGPSCDSKNWYR